MQTYKRGKLPVYLLSLDDMIENVKSLFEEYISENMVIGEMHRRGYRIEDTKIVLYHALNSEN